MRTATVLFFVATLFAAGLCMAADESAAPLSANAAQIAKVDGVTPLAMPTPRMYVAPQAKQNFDLLPEADNKDSVCLVMHVKVVKEDDKTGITYPVRETDCVDGSRFQLKQATAPAK